MHGLLGKRLRVAFLFDGHVLDSIIPHLPLTQDALKISPVRCRGMKGAFGGLGIESHLVGVKASSCEVSSSMLAAIKGSHI